MKHSILALFIMIGCSFTLPCFAQQDSIPLMKRFPLPPFSIIKYPDSTQFSKDDLSRKKAVMIMIFSPDCHHCQVATRDLLAHMDLFKDVQIVMATALEYKYIKPFYDDFQLSNYKNITVGWDRTYFLGSFFGIKEFPSIFLYNKKGKFVANFEGSVPFTKIAESL